MRSDEFRLLGYHEQLSILQSEGVYIGKKNRGETVAILFQLSDFYVEVVYSQYRSIIDHINVSESTEVLINYLDQVDIPDLNINQ